MEPAEQRILLASLIRDEFRTSQRQASGLVVLKGGEGLGNRLYGFLEAVVYSVISGRTLFVDWRDGIYAAPGQNAFPLLFDSPLVTPNLDVDPSASVLPEAWAGMLGCSYDEVVERLGLAVDYDSWRDVRRKLSIDPDIRHYPAQAVVMYNLHFRFSKFSRYLKITAPFEEPAHELTGLRALRRAAGTVRSEIQSDADNFRERSFTSPMIGVHVRQTDNMQHPRKSVSFEPYPALIESIIRRRQGAHIFLATDSPGIEDEMRRRFGNVLMAAKFFPPHNRALHHRTGDEDRERIGKEALVDMCLLAACDEMVYSAKSSFAKGAILLSDRDPDCFHDVETAAPL